MSKHKDRRIRTSKAVLATPAARPVDQRVTLAVEQEGARLATTTSVPQPKPLPSRYLDGYGGSSEPDATGQIGTTGVLNVFGYITGEDYNPDLDGYAMFPNYNKMRLSDAQVNATLLMLKLPLKGATWIVKPASDDPQDIAIADFVQANLLDDDALARSWQHVLDNAMLKFDFGCSAAEIVWDLSPESPEALSRITRAVHLARGGDREDLRELAASDAPLYARVTDLAPRLPRTFYRWVEDQTTGRLAYLQQFAPKFGQYGYWNIPAANLALHVRGREGNSYYGRSTLRTSYPHWWWKQQLYRIDMIGHDRFHVGIPRAKLLDTYNAAAAPLDKIERTLKGLRSHDRAYMVQPAGVEYDVYAPLPGTATSSIIQSIEHHNQMIARNILQSFSAQGEQRHGSFGAAKVTSDVYFDALDGEANEIGSELKQTVVKPLCDRNFDMRGRKYPQIICTDISAVDFLQLSQAFATLADKGLVTPSDDLEEFFRDLADAPDLPEELKGQDRTVKVAVTHPAGAPPAASVPTLPAKTPKAIAAAKRTPYLERGRAFSRKPTMLERQVLDLHGIPKRLDAAQAQLVTEMAAIRRRQLKTVAQRIAQKDGRDTAPFTDIRHTQIAMPEIGAMVKVIRAAQTEALAYGGDTVRSELTRQGVKRLSLAENPTAAANKRTATSTLVSSAQITAKKQGEQWRARILDTGLRFRRGGLQGEALATKIEAALEGEIESGAKLDAAKELHEAFGLGRAGAAQDHKDDIDHAIYSAILDANTCENCAALDGDEFQIDSAEYEASLPPNPECLGGDACRCLDIFVTKDEAE